MRVLAYLSSPFRATTCKSRPSPPVRRITANGPCHFLLQAVSLVHVTGCFFSAVLVTKLLRSCFSGGRAVGLHDTTTGHALSGRAPPTWHVRVGAAPACPDAGLMKILGPPRYNRCLTFCARDACISYEGAQCRRAACPLFCPRERRQSAPSVAWSVLPSEHNGQRCPAIRQEQEPLEVDAA